MYINILHLLGNCVFVFHCVDKITTCYYRNITKKKILPPPPIFTQPSVSIYNFLCFVFMYVKKIYDTFKQGRRLSFGMLIVLTNIRSTKVL